MLIGSLRPYRKIGLQGMHCFLLKKDHVLLASFTRNPQHLMLQVKLRNSNCNELTHPDTCLYQKLEESIIPGASSCCGYHPLELIVS